MDSPHTSTASTVAYSCGGMCRDKTAAGEGYDTLQGGGKHDVMAHAEHALDAVWHVTWTGRFRSGIVSSVVEVLEKSDDRGKSQGIPCAAADSMAD